MPHCEAHLFMKTVSPEPPVWLAGSTTGGSPLLIAVTYLLIALVGRPWTFCHFLRFVGLINFISFPRLLTFPLSLGNIFFLYLLNFILRISVLSGGMTVCNVCVWKLQRSEAGTGSPGPDCESPYGYWIRTWVFCKNKSSYPLSHFSSTKQLHNSDKTKIILKVRSWTYKLVELKSWR